MHSDEVNALGTIVRFILSLFVMFFMVNEVLFTTPHCDINIMVSGFILIWLATFRIWK